MKDNHLTIATSQHNISGDVTQNLSSILRQTKIAKSKNADIVHFPECNLSGYTGIDIPEIKRDDYPEIQKALEEIKGLAKRLVIHIIVGCHHFMGTNEKPTNCLHLINSKGEVEVRYDKRILTGKHGKMEHKYYVPGENPGIFTINNIKCGMLICHEWRYPELYREYKSLGVKIIFQSWYDGNLSKADFESEGKETGTLITGTTRGTAANNYLWISGSNTSKKESCFPSFVMQPDGKILSKLQRNKPGVLISQIDLDQKFEDPSFYGRKRFI